MSKSKQTKSNTDAKDETKKDDEQEITRFLLRPTAEMHERTKDLAKHSRRSINAQYMYMVQCFFNDIDEEEYYNNPNPDDVFFSSKHAGSDKVKGIKAELENKLPRLRKLILEKEKLILILENNLFLLKDFLDNNHHIGLKIQLDTTQEKLANLEKQKKLLEEAKEMLRYFQKMDPQFERNYSFDLGTELPGYVNVLRPTLNNNKIISENFDDIVTKMIEMDKIINRDMTEKI